MAVKAFIEIEWVGKDTDDLLYKMGERAIRRPWCAKVELSRKGFQRRFMSGSVDYSRANSKGSRGVFMEFILPEGVYECFGSSTWSASSRFHVASIGGKIKTISKEEAERWLSEGLV